MFWCGIELHKQEQAFISNVSCRRDYSPTEGSVTSVPVSCSEGGVASVFASAREGDVSSVSVSLSRDVMSPDSVIPSPYRS